MNHNHVERSVQGMGRQPERPAGQVVAESFATVGVAGATASLWWIVPENPFAHLSEPAYLAIVGYFVALAALVALRATRGRGSRHEQLLLAVFLVAMPLVYVASAWLSGGRAGNLWVETAGLVLYGAIAALGGRRSLRILALGIALHGLWDLAHFQRSTCVPDWFALACVIVDFALGAFVAVTSGTYESRSRATTRSAPSSW
jgi:hypothetical protein